MFTILRRSLEVTLSPETFFERIREEKRWLPIFGQLIFLMFWLSLGSVIAWGLGVAGDTPLNSSLGSQMDIYPFWRDTLLPEHGIWAYPIAMGLIMLEMAVITLIWVPIIFVVFQFLGGARESNGFLHACQGFVYGLTPCAFGGFLPGLGLLTGVYATVLQFYRGPAITLRNRSCVPYLFLALFLAYAIARYWNHSLL